VQWRELDRGFELLLDGVVDQDRFAEAPAAVDDAVGDPRDPVRNRIEGIDPRRGSVGVDNRELQARRTGVDD
jgi:hypothetical protein